MSRDLLAMQTLTEDFEFDEFKTMEENCKNTMAWIAEERTHTEHG